MSDANTMGMGSFSIGGKPVITNKGFSITDNAADWIMKLVAGEGVSLETHALRIAILGGGCSGYKYDIRWDEPRGDDELITHENGARVCIDPKSLALVAGSHLEYFARLQGAGFTIVNPNATGTCGCGESFSI